MSGEYKRLYRAVDERMVAGVCGGLANYFNVDPTLVRVLFVLAAMAGGPGLIAYIILVIVMPEEPTGYVAPSATGTAPQADVQVETVEADESA